MPSKGEKNRKIISFINLLLFISWKTPSCIVGLYTPVSGYELQSLTLVSFVYVDCFKEWFMLPSWVETITVPRPSVSQRITSTGNSSTTEGHSPAWKIPLKVLTKWGRNLHIKMSWEAGVGGDERGGAGRGGERNKPAQTQVWMWLRKAATHRPKMHVRWGARRPSPDSLFSFVQGDPALLPCSSHGNKMRDHSSFLC